MVKAAIFYKIDKLGHCFLAPEHERMAAVLHDVVEDSDITYDDLISEGFPKEVVDAVRALTDLPP